VSTAFVICGALAREVLEIVERRGWDATVVGVPALIHMTPARIAPAVEKRILQLREQYDNLLVVYGDCGSSGALDETLARLDVPRTAGPHCYEMYGGDLFQQLMDEEPGTYFLTDFLLRGFEGLVVKGMGLDRHPELKDVYFANYQRLAYLAQTDDPDLRAKAEEVAAYLDLPLTVYVVGTGVLEARLVAFMRSVGVEPGPEPVPREQLARPTAP
jgi:hypothetical protein